MFENLKLINYKGLKECELRELGHINVICGKNNTGKSTVLEAINSKDNRLHGKSTTSKFLTDLAKKSAKSIDLPSPERLIVYESILKKILPEGEICYEKQNDKIRQDLIKMLKKEGLAYQIQSDFFDNSYAQVVAKSYDTLLIPPKRSLELSKDIRVNDSTDNHGSGILNRLFYYKNQPEGTESKDIYNKIRDHFLEISDGYGFDIHMNNKNIVTLNFSREKNEWIAASDCGLGLQDLLVLLWFATEPTKKVLLIEEPESHMHPEMQRKLLQFFKRQTNKQFFLTTHSNVFVNNAYADRVFFTQYNTSIEVQDATSRAFVLNDLGYSVTDNLISDLVILVEGPTDAPVIEELLVKMDIYSKHNIKIWPLGGDIMDQLDLSIFTQNYKILALIDKDPLSASIRKRFMETCEKNNIPVHKLDRYSIENYFSLRALREVFGSQIDSSVEEINPNEKLETQIGINVKRNNRKITQAMTLDEISGTDLENFLGTVVERCKA